MLPENFHVFNFQATSFDVVSRILSKKFLKSRKTILRLKFKVDLQKIFTFLTSKQLPLISSTEILLPIVKSFQSLLKSTTNSPLEAFSAVFNNILLFPSVQMTPSNNTLSSYPERFPPLATTDVINIAKNI